jgi:CheY-like chemotaxis protein
MASITLAATLNTPKSELRPATIDRILVIEHDRALQKILQRLFSSEGYEVDVVPGGVAGLEMLRQRPPSLVVLDLPYAESSGDLYRQIANLIPGLPLVILSASSDDAHSPSSGNGCRRLRDHTVQPEGTCGSSAYAHEEEAARQPGELACL